MKDLSRDDPIISWFTGRQRNLMEPVHLSDKYSCERSSTASNRNPVGAHERAHEGATPVLPLGTMVIPLIRTQWCGQQWIGSGAKVWRGQHWIGPGATLGLAGNEKAGWLWLQGGGVTRKRGEWVMRSKDRPNQKCGSSDVDQHIPCTGVIPPRHQQIHGHLTRQNPSAWP
jgi:hypothetical protein